MYWPREFQSVPLISINRAANAPVNKDFVFSPASNILY
jgi:hypothetical protein